jgi:hypothetical protein
MSFVRKIYEKCLLFEKKGSESKGNHIRNEVIRTQ